MIHHHKIPPFHGWIGSWKKLWEKIEKIGELQGRVEIFHRSIDIVARDPYHGALYVVGPRNETRVLYQGNPFSMKHFQVGKPK